MKEFYNQFYSSNNNHFNSIKNQLPTPERLRMVKLNNKFLFTLFSAMRTSQSREEFMSSKIYQKYKNTFLTGSLYKNDNLTGFNTKNLGEKIKFLVMAFCDESHPENMKKIQNSTFLKDILPILYHGGIPNQNADSDERWELYRHTTSNQKYKNLSPLNGAVSCYVNDPSLPVGIDFSTLIDGIVKQDRYGNYEIREEIVDIKENENFVLAIKNFVDLIKSSEEFNANYKNDNIIASEMEDE